MDDLIKKILNVIGEYLEREEQEEVHPPPPVVEDEFVGNEKWRMSIACDSRNQPHIVTDVGGEPVSYFYDRINNQWVEKSFDSGGNTPQAYNPYIHITKSDKIFITVVKWHAQGMGLMARIDAAFNASDVIAYIPTQGGMPAGSLPVGLCSIEPNSEDTVVVYAGNGGHWQKYLLDGQKLLSIATGIIECGRGGEKNGFDISAKNVWHVCSDWSYNNDGRNASPLNWLDVDTYINWIGHDTCYPAVVGDSEEDQTAYLLTDLTQFGGPGLMFQIYRNGSFLAPLNYLFNLDPNGTSGSIRYPPQACASNNTGIYVAYQVDNTTLIKYISPDGNVELIKEFVGSRPSITVDSEEKLHICYIKDGIRYRRIDGKKFGDENGSNC